jgi:hypothetical protein
MPDQAAALRRKLHQWRASVGTQMPVANPDYRANVPAPKSQKAKKRAAAEVQRVLEES